MNPIPSGIKGSVINIEGLKYINGVGLKGIPSKAKNFVI